MDLRIVMLYYVCSAAGLLMIAGGILLIYKQKIYIDKETNQVTEIETPVGKFRTNVPALALFALGFVPLIYPIYKSGDIEPEKVKILGEVHATVHPVLVHGVIVSEPLSQDRQFSFQLPIVEGKDRDYKILYIAGNTVVEENIDMSQAVNGQIILKDKEILAQSTEYETGEILASVPAEFR